VDARGFVTVVWEAQGPYDTDLQEFVAELWTSRFACRTEPAEGTSRETAPDPAELPKPDCLVADSDRCDACGWGAPFRIATDLAGMGYRFDPPHVSAGPGGRASVLFRDRSQLMGTSRREDGTWTVPEPLLSEPTDFIFVQRLAALSSGGAAPMLGSISRLVLR
jgi:hypothetical protein